MTFRCIAGTFALFLTIACAPVTGDTAVVRGVGPDDLLKLRAGPSLGFNIRYGLPDGTRLIRRKCVTEVGQRWCEVSLADAPQITGYVSADYIADR